MVTARYLEAITGFEGSPEPCAGIIHNCRNFASSGKVELLLSDATLTATTSLDDGVTVTVLPRNGWPGFHCHDM